MLTVAIVNHKCLPTPERQSPGFFKTARREWRFFVGIFLAIEIVNIFIGNMKIISYVEIRRAIAILQ